MSVSGPQKVGLAKKRREGAPEKKLIKEAQGGGKMSHEEGRGSGDVRTEPKRSGSAEKDVRSVWGENDGKNRIRPMKGGHGYHTKGEKMISEQGYGHHGIAT